MYSKNIIVDKDLYQTVSEKKIQSLRLKAFLVIFISTISIQSQLKAQSQACLITSSVNSMCEGATASLCAPTGYTVYQWSNGMTTRCIIVNSPGVYTVTAILKSKGAPDVSITCSKTILELESPASTITTANSTICQGTTANLCAPAGNSSYSWNTGETTSCINVSASGNYTLTTIGSNGCSSTSSKTITVSPPPSSTITGSNGTLCFGKTANLCAPAGNSYAWNTGASGQCITIASEGIYQVTVTNSSGCSSSSSLAIQSVSAPSVSITGSNGSICQESVATLCATGNFNAYQWSTSATTPCINVTNAGVYTVTATNANGCSNSASQSISVTPLGVGTISGSNGTLCQGQVTTLMAPAGYESYLWNNGQTTASISINAAGTYTVKALRPLPGNPSGCGVLASQTVTVSPAMSCTISGLGSICQGGSTQLCAATGMASYLWSNGETTPCINVTAGGTYSVTMVNASGCSSTCSKNVVVYPAPVCSINGSTSFCPGGSTQLCATEGMLSYQWNSNPVTDINCINISSPGTYTVVATNNNGCSSTCSQVVTMNVPVSCTISGSDGNMCSGQSTTLCATPGMGTYSWNNGATTECITINAPGTYTVLVNGNTSNPNSNCSSSCSKTISLQPLNCTISGSNGTICQGQSATLCAPAGMTSYQWSTGATTECISVNSAGNYSVTISNQQGCSASATQSITVNQQGNCSITGSNTICNGQSTTLCAPTGYSNYLWNTGATVRCIDVTSAGTYSVTVSNGGAGSTCSSSCSKTVTMSSPTPLTISGSNGMLCSGQTATICSPAGFTSYSWSNGSTAQCIDVSAAGTYSVVATNAVGCTSTGNMVISIVPPVTLSISGTATICQGQSTSLCAASGFDTYLWSNGATTSCISVNAAGTYSVVATKGVNACTYTASRTVTVNPVPNCSISGSSTICPGGSAQLCAITGMTSYQWSNGATSECITITTGGTYTVTVTNANGCTSSCSKTVTVAMPPPCTISGNSSFCPGTSTQICASPGMASYLWSTGETTQCIAVTAAGTYSVTGTNFTGCSSTCSKTLTLSNATNCAITGNTSFCAGGSTELCAPAGMYAYLWSTGATTQCIAVNNPGIYSVILTTASACNSSCSKTVTLNNATACSITGPSTICPGSSSQLCASPGATSYLWSTGATTQCINVTSGGNYTVTTTNSSGCTSTCSKSMTIGSPAIAGITGNATICSGGSTQLCAPGGYSSYLWSNGSTTSCINVNTTGTYSVTISDGIGCSSTAFKTITAGMAPVCSILGASTICNGGTTQLCGPDGLYTYSWNNGPATDDPCITVSTTGTHTLTITNQAGCISTCTKTVTITPPATCSITGNTAICQGNSSTICAPAGYASYLWNNGTTSQCLSANSTGNYSVVLTDANGCTSVCSKPVNVYSCGISLTVTPSVCEIVQGTPTPVTFTYEIKNNGTNFSASGTLIDDNGTYANTADDIVIANWGPLAPGAIASYTRTITVSGNYSNIAIASGITAGTPVTAIGSATIKTISCSCNLSYPDNSNLPRSAVIFNESEVLRASDPGTTSCGTTGSEIKLWYNDEHALTLGVSRVVVKTSSGTTTTDYPVTPAPAGFGCVSNPLVGDTISSGDQSGNDVAAGGGRPLWPALFITDLTVNGPQSRAGDWQQGGKGIPPTRVCGTWKSAIRSVDKTSNPERVTITPNADPPKNNWNLGTGSHTPPGGFALLENEGYGAEIVWSVNQLGLIPGHTYRLQFMVHDGDQNKTGGDVGQNCTTIHIPAANCTSTLNVGSHVWSDDNKNGLRDNNEAGIGGLKVNLYADANNDNNADAGPIGTINTDNAGAYSFSNLAPGNYIVGVMIGANDTPSPVNGGDPDNNIDNDNNGVKMVNGELRSDAVTLMIGSEPINDGDGSNGNLTVDFGIVRPAPEVEKKCYVGTLHNYVIATQTWTVDQAAGTATIRTVFSRNFVDNTYGINSIGWSNGHSFSQLTGSDKLQIALFDVNNVMRMEFKLDYISADAGAASGYRSLGATGGDGGMLTGSASDIVSWNSSLAKNFNEFGYKLETNSPATNNNYAVNSNYPNWIFDVWYEVTVKLSAFPAGFGEPVITSIHASPSKTGTNTEPMEENMCNPLRTAAAMAPVKKNINAYIYPNPAKSVAHFTFERTGTKSHATVELFTISGSRVARIFDEDIEPDILYKVDYNTGDLPAGTYSYKIVSDDKVITGKLIILNE